MNSNELIENRANIGRRNVSQIMSLLKNISLGHHYFKIEKVLREAILINGMLFGGAAWYDISEKNLRTLEKIDESLLRQVLGAHSKTPLEALYLELGCKPIRFHLLTKRINFLHYLLNLNESELLRKVFTAQLDNPLNATGFCK